MDYQDMIEERWSVDFGDRLNELVLIGINMNEQEIRLQLERCICTNDEIMEMQDGLFSSKDPFPIPKQFAENVNKAVFYDL